ncbi:single-stranded DNA-binding protein [Chloroflexus sp.]|uniref:single-stranded DNA-binding protein n=1 Tax=Chloroflexus sp. TaxID=1904827 RepID=UPI00298F1F9E|nr:single-stranded DNA-binding protein [Chloroflexus sp.]MCS6887353.1 single-stranded DNA-binding protein [Chloroflexus sp.]MCX7858940.1 single-stranded DNA-binding protein [Chloroflexus sp.]MDW8404661.1 single-stranded DNA-binding protein [Chloroflexus sp.]
MARDLNKVLIIGRLGADPELRYTSAGTPVATFRVAASRQWRDPNGSLHDETEWFNIVAWNRLAEICHQYLSRGARVYIEGRLQTRTWEDPQTGQSRSRVEVVAQDMILLEQREPRTDDAPRPPRREPPPDIGDDDIPF